MFTYHHPSLVQRKSHLDRIYVNFVNHRLKGYASHVSISDHYYLVSMFEIPLIDYGPKIWRFNSDTLLDPAFRDRARLSYANFSTKDVCAEWESLKAKFQNYARVSMQYRIKQAKREISSFHQTLNYLNKWIYAGDNMDLDHLKVEARLSQCCDRMQCLSDSTSWVSIEGKPFKKFLHLEDICSENKLHTLLDKEGNERSDVDSVLSILKDFYTDLYAAQVGERSQVDIQKFLNEIPSILKITSSIDILVSPITENEVEAAIKKLRTGKSPGCDGLTADFYKHFFEELVPIPIDIFNAVFENKELTISQKIAIIVLIFKKGDEKLVGNYCPISLTNCDYKILAYVLVGRLEEFLPQIIHPNQTAYMKSHFISTNIHSVQDVMTNSAEENRIVLFLDFRKAFDTVNHLFPFSLLVYISFPPDFMTWITLMYSGALSTVCHKNWLTETFPLLRGDC